MNSVKRRFDVKLLSMVAIAAFVGMVLCNQAFAGRTYAPDGKGYLDYIITDTGHQQPFLHLEGTGYEMGFQHGYLMGAAAADVATDDFFIYIGRNYVSRLGKLGDTIADLFLTDVGKLLGVNYLTSGKTPADFLIDAFKIIAKQNEKYIPQEYLDEMHGIADGARAAGIDLDYENILLVNVGFDAFLSVAYPIATPLLITADKAGELLKGLQLSCNAFVMDGNATLDHSLYLGRDFMFSGPGFTDHPVIFEIYGNNGRNRVISVGVAGIVGSIAAMNEKGLGIGMDMVPSTDCTPGDVGMGTLLTARRVMEKANELSQGVKIITDSKRGASWLYVLADGQGAERGGNSVEVSAHHVYTRGMGWTINPLVQLVTPVKQQEKYPDVLIQTNHYVKPDMYANVPLNYAARDSKYRYDRMIEILKDPYHPLGGYGTYDFDKAFDYINWMHLTGEGNETPDSKVNQSTTLFDLTNLRMKTLCGPTFAEGATEYDWRK
ncbi:MAG: C45 family autoproteolytic acyltransferase/hydrolase [Deltaproteobacteria bacterium]|nr:C45 family autoproteolytic acyltransferase/hydrolase [Deltaproteobacteria bacterium]